MTSRALFGRISAAAVCFALTATAQCPPRRGGGGGEIYTPPPPPPPYRGPGDIARPSGPGAPGPAAPAAPGPTAPRSDGGGRRGPHTPAGSPAAPAMAIPRGAPITFTHRGTSLGQLRIDWDYPTFVGDTGGDTVAKKVFAALPYDEALRRVAGDDPRPLLLLRECWLCQGSESALLDVKEANEKTILFARWFHCVRFDDSIRHEQHPFHALFKDNAMPHLVLCTRDGSTLTRLDGKRPQSALWTAMRTVLRQAYTEDPDVAVRELFKVLAQFDHLDSMEAEVSAQLQAALEQQAKDSPRVRELQAEREQIVSKRDDLEKRQAELMDLGLKSVAAAAATTPVVEGRR